MQIRKIHPQVEVAQGVAIFINIYILTWNILHLPYLVGYLNPLDILLFVQRKGTAVKMTIISDAYASICLLFFNAGMLMK